MSQIKVNQPEWKVPSKVRAITTTRIGGVSAPPYDGLNLGNHMHDLPEAVSSNRAALRTECELPSEPCWLNQVHGMSVVELLRESPAEKPNADMPNVLPTADGSLCTVDGSAFTADGSSRTADGSAFTADGSITSEVGVVCAVLTADCLPLLLTNEAADRVAAIHVGWRGMASGIIEKAVIKMGCSPANIIAWAGPCIGPNSFVVGTEVQAQLGGPSSAYLPASTGKVYANLYQLAGERLANAGVSNYRHSQACTYLESEHYFSYRRDRECGRMASLIWLDGDRRSAAPQ